MDLEEEASRRTLGWPSCVLLPGPVASPLVCTGRVRLDGGAFYNSERKREKTPWEEHRAGWVGPTGNASLPLRPQRAYRSPLRSWELSLLAILDLGDRALTCAGSPHQVS